MLLFNSSIVSAQWQYHINHQECIGGIGFQDAQYSINQTNRIIITHDHGIIFTFNLLKDTSMHLSFLGSNDIYVQKNDSIGNLSWKRIIGSSKAESNPSIFASTDSGFILTFASNGRDSDVTCFHIDSTMPSQTNGSQQMFKLDKNGNIQHSGCYGDSHHQSGFSRSIPCHDGGYLLLGSFGYPCDSSTSGSFIKIDSLFQEQWRFCMESSGTNTTACETSDGGFIFTKISDTLFYGITGLGANIGIVKVNSSGNFLWAKTYGSSANDFIINSIS